MNGAARGAVVGGVFLTMVGATGYGVYALVGDGSGGGGTRPVAEQRSGPPSERETARTAKEFLAAWAAGDERAAADLTNNAALAQSAVGEFRTAAYVSKAVITPGTPTGGTVPFTVAADVTYEGVTKPLTYESKLTVVRGATGGKPLVDWKSSILHPQLQSDEKLRAGAAPTPPVKAVDRDGAELTAQKYPSLKPVLDQLRKTYGTAAGGTPGVELWIEPAARDAPRRVLLTLSQGTPGLLKTVLDADVQAAAEKAVAAYPESSVVAVQPSTGHILAVANHRADGFDAAMRGTRAPGSTMKIVTASMLINRGVVSADKAVDCPKTVSGGGRSFHNLENMELKGASFATDFARSCNTAFIGQMKAVGDESAMAAEARGVFGLGLEWSTGVPSFDGDVPAASGPEAAAEYIGQGRIRTSPLNIASVTATAKTGVFRQPVIIEAGQGARVLARAERQMKPGTSRQLVQMMRQTATSGTAAEVMASVGGDKGAKTGSAEVDGAGSPDSWFTGFSGDVAAAAMVQAGGHGVDAAGPLVAQILTAS
ncbi:penicillin-binding transpeptidase domain-containing protein [Streptomyces sp. G-G2]|uniref:penicillin-binding transpeptidase domain-containing protein n=1 Tax=Streptomyces sp. G-G2 TaxID=3046201 RepID=UPI0024B98CD7|nr:penicillin-binding transpeptidase domain-containing protein [Streptomyces sp. G-G2]MDJ0380562.1 penicillin-binding transpeptidase domain-containing protein [Streptomyces sp. G-G2]